MEFRILGPLEVQATAGPLRLGGTKQRALLAVLLLHANEVVSSDGLIDALWGLRAPATAGKALHGYVSALRKLLEPQRARGDPHRVLLTRAPGYLLHVEAEQFDLRRFERLRAQAREALGVDDPATARATLGEALALWRGQPLADLAYASFAQTEIARLQELRLGAHEERIEADLALGHHADLIGELEALIAEHPLRERLRAQLMLALYRSGRQAEALEVYQHARSALTEELGIEPGRDLRDLQRAMLQQAPALELQPGEKIAAVSARRSFVGRGRELAQLVGALEDALAGRGRLVLLAGEPGIGKSRLADELTGRARARGAQVLTGRCWEAGGAPAYWPWVHALRAYVRDTEPEALRAQLGAGAADLAQLLPELRDLFPDLPEPPALEAEGARFRIFESAVTFLRHATRIRPLVLILDDVHAADEPSLLLLRFVARELTDSRLLMIAAFRDVDPAPRDPLSSALAELVGERQTLQIALAGLAAPDVAEYLALATGNEPAPQLVEAIHAETEGNPLFVAEIVHLLAAEDRIAEADAHRRIPPGVRAVIGRRLARLSAPCRSVLSGAAVMGREFGLDALIRLSEFPRDELLGALDEAIAERVVGDVPGSRGRFRFGHALIRDTLYDDLSTARRLALHQDAGAALEAVYASDPEPHLAELAHHFLAATPAGTAAKAIAYARRAGDRAVAQLAYEEAVRHYALALTLVEGPVERCDLLLALGDAQARAGVTPAANQAFRAAAELAERRGLAEHLARAALGYGGRMLYEGSRGDPYVVGLLEHALAALGSGDSPMRVRLLARLAGGPLRDARFPPERKATLSREALAIARRLGDRGVLAYAIDGFILAHASPVHADSLLELGAELVEVATEAGDKERAVDGHETRLLALLGFGEIEGAKVELKAMGSLAQELRQPSHEWLLGVYRAMLALLEGRLAEAESLISGARRLGEHAQSWNATVSYRLQFYVLRRAQGRLVEVEDLVRQSVDEYPTYPIWRCLIVHMTAELGDAAVAREAFAALAAEDFAGVTSDEGWLVNMGFLAEAASTLGDAERASVLYRQLLRYGDRVAITYAEISTGAVARSLGLLAATMGRLDDAARHFEDALAVNRRIAARPYLAHTQDDYARMLLARGRPGDGERAGKLIAAALVTYRQVGMETWADALALEWGAEPTAPRDGSAGATPGVYR